MAGSEVRLEDRDGMEYAGKWAGSATHEKLGSFWLSKRFPGNQLLQIPDEVTAVSETDRDTKETVWTQAPPDTRLFFLLEASPPGRSYRLAKLVTIKATDEQRAYFNNENESVPFTGRYEGEALIHVPLPPPPPRVKAQPDLF